MKNKEKTSHLQVARKIKTLTEEENTDIVLLQGKLFYFEGNFFYF